MQHPAEQVDKITEKVISNGEKILYKESNPYAGEAGHYAVIMKKRTLMFIESLMFARIINH